MRPTLFLLLALVGLCGSAPAQQQPRPPWYGNLTWSPNSKTLLFESTRDGKYAIYAADPAKGAVTRLTPVESNNEQAGWSPNSRTIVFASDRDGHMQLYLMDRDGKHPRRLTHTDSTEEFFPTFAPDGRSILFSFQPRKRWADYQVGVVRPDGSDRREVTTANNTSEGPRWSPDGTRILFERGPALQKNFGSATRDEVMGRRKLMQRVSVLPDGSGERPEPAEASAAQFLRSPNGRWQAEVRTGGDSAGVYLTEVKKGKVRRI